MSLLNRGNEFVKVFQEIQAVETDSDGNRVSRPSKVGTTYRASVQPISSTEPNEAGGHHTVSRHRLRLVGYPGVLGAQSQIEWNGKRYSIVGNGMEYNGSRRTSHVAYVIVRS